MMQTPRKRSSSEQQDAVWRTLFQKQEPALHSDMCSVFLEGFRRAGLNPERMPRHRELSYKLYDRIGWRIETVPGLIPAADFFTLLRDRRFPSPEWIRHPDDLTYTPEPDLFHDVFGHVPQLAAPEIEAVIESMADTAAGASPQKIEELGRVYWFTAEFGLVKTPAAGLKGWGAGLASSIAELHRALKDPQVIRRPLVVSGAAATPFETDHQQPVYMVASSLTELSARIPSVFGSVVSEEVKVQAGNLKEIQHAR